MKKLDLSRIKSRFRAAPAENGGAVGPEEVMRPVRRSHVHAFSLWSVVKWMNWLHVIVAVPALITASLILLDHIPGFIDPPTTLAGAIAAFSLIPLLNSLIFTAVARAYECGIHELKVSVAHWFPLLFLKETEDGSRDVELLPLFLSRAAYDLFLGSLLTVWAVIGGHAFGLGAAVACVLHILGYLKFEDDCDGMKILQIAWAIDKMLAEYDYSEEEVDCEQVSFFDDELPCEAAPQSEIHVAASEGGRNASIHDLLSSNVMLASISLLLVKICAVTVYGVTAVMILANVIHVLF